MKSLKNLFNSNQNTAWQDAVMVKLDGLTESQSQVRKELDELVAAARPTPNAA